MRKFIRMTMTQTIRVRQEAPDDMALGPITGVNLAAIKAEADAEAAEMAEDDPDIDILSQHIVFAEVFEE